MIGGQYAKSGRPNETLWHCQEQLVRVCENHITDINNDGQNHIVTDRKVKWFDDYAVQRIDELRGYNSNVTLAAEAAKADRERELLEENSQLKTRLLLMAEEKHRFIRSWPSIKGISF